jgi:hypothetical protein
MPEGPPLFYLKEELDRLYGQKFRDAVAISKIDQQRLVGKQSGHKNLGKHMLWCFDDFIHSYPLSHVWYLLH